MCSPHIRFKATSCALQYATMNVEGGPPPPDSDRSVPTAGLAFALAEESE
jgi:hypothetical protein